MKYLSEAIKDLIQQGVYSLYRLEDGRNIVYTPPKLPCCSSHPRPAAIYVVNDDGDFVGVLEDNDLRNYKIKEVIHVS